MTIYWYIYIAGYVVKKAMSQITCDECRSALVSHEPSEKYGSAYCFLTIRKSGSLAIPSEGVLAIVFAAERHLRTSTDLNKVNQACTLLRVQRKVLAQLGAKNVLNNADHAIDSQVGIDNHYYFTVRIIVKIFFNIRQYHIVRLHNLKQRGQVVRQKLTKSILFMGQ